MLDTNQQWAPSADDNPYKTWSMKTAEEWKEVSRWYPGQGSVLSILRDLRKGNI